MNYEQKYKEALEGIRNLRDMLLKEEVINKDGVIAENLESIFPELKESEDERIKSCIRDVIKDYDFARVYGCKKDECIAWLEKQDAQTIKEALRTEYEKGRADAIAEFEKQGEQKPYTFNAIPRLLEAIKPTDRVKEYCQKLIYSLEKEGYNADAMIVRGILKQWNGEEVPMATMDEQNPVWSEEDEKILGKCIEAASGYYSPEDKQSMKDWLRQLKGRIVLQLQPKQEL